MYILCRKHYNCFHHFQYYWPFMGLIFYMSKNKLFCKITSKTVSSICPSLILVAFTFCLLTLTKLFIGGCFFPDFFLVQEIVANFYHAIMINASSLCLYLHNGVFWVIALIKKFKILSSSLFTCVQICKQS